MIDEWLLSWEKASGRVRGSPSGPTGAVRRVRPRDRHRPVMMEMTRDVGRSAGLDGSAPQVGGSDVVLSNGILERIEYFAGIEWLLEPHNTLY